MPQRLCFVDLETTGSNPLTDAITEVAIVSVDEHGNVEEWSSLVNPFQPISDFIQGLTGITPDMVAKAPAFEDVADEVWKRLQGCIFIAHNARFDYGFLRAVFRKLDKRLQVTVLCTVKLSRFLNQREPKHNLDSLITRHGLPTGERHRALSDARVVWELWQFWQRTESPERLQQGIAEVTRRPSLPASIDPDIVDELPSGVGVYVFYGDNNQALFIGRSTHVKHRILTHFASDKISGQDVQLAQHVKRIEWQTTAGELGALLLEIELLRQLKPSLQHNKNLKEQQVCSWFWQGNMVEAPTLVLANDSRFGQVNAIFGLYRSNRDAQRSLQKLADKHRLCLKTLGIEKGKTGQPCASRLKKKCHGYCVGAETAEQLQQRLGQALAELKVARWQFSGPVGLREHNDRTHQTSVHWVDHWCYLGSTLEEERPCTRPLVFDVDHYKILTKALKHWPEADVIVTT